MVGQPKGTRLVPIGPADLRQVAVDDLTRLRFAASPMWETVASLRVLKASSCAGGSRPGGLHAPWVGRAHTVLADRRLSLPTLDALVPASRHLADFLTPTPRRRDVTFADELRAVSEMDESIVAEDLAVLLEAAPTPRARALLSAHRDDPAALRSRAVDELQRYWEAVLAPEWPRLRALAEADVAFRMDQMATGGAHGVLASLHPRVRMEGHALVIEKACRPGPVVPGRGLVLVPCAFAWPELLFFDVPGHAPTLSYAPRGVGNLWRPADTGDVSALALLVGRTRAAALQLLDLPMTTTQVASHVEVTAPTMSQHLRVLAGAGLVESRRRGREVLYARTPLGSELVARG